MTIRRRQGFGRREAAASAPGGAAFAQLAPARAAAVAVPAPPPVDEPPEREALRALAQRLDLSRSALDRRLVRVENKALEATGRRHRLRPLLIIPEPTWRGRHGRFLLHALQLNPYDEWNVAILPADHAGAAALDLPRHPGADIVNHHIATDAIGRFKQGYVESFEIADWTADRSDIERGREEAIERTKQYALECLDAWLVSVGAKKPDDEESASAGPEGETAAAAPDA